MINVKNKEVVAKLAHKSLKANRLRNIFAICAIAMTAVLFTTLFTLGIGTVEGVQQAAMRQAGGGGHAALKYITDEIYNTVKNHPLIKEISYNRMLSDGVENEELQKRRCELWYMDETGLRMGFCEPTSGHVPVKENELITDTKTLELLGVDQKVGAPITLILTIRGERVAREFTLAGWWESDPVFNVGMLVTSRAYVDAHSEELVNTYREDYSLTGAINAYLIFRDSMNMQERLDTVIIQSGYSLNEKDENYIESNVNWSYLSASFGLDSGTVVIVLSGLILVSLTGYLIIYNIFQISVIRDIRFYGLLKTIGTTGRQLRTMIRRQALYLSFIGIPIGLILGFLLGKGLVPLIVNRSSYSGSHVVISPNPLIFIGAAVFALLTVIVSTYKPVRLAGSVSPIEAVRFHEESGKAKSRLKISTGGTKMYRMALSNLGRSKKRTILVILSLSLSLVLFNTVYTISQCVDMDKFLSKFVDTDFLIANNDYFRNEFFGAGSETSETFIHAVEEQKGFLEGGRLYGGRNTGFAVEDSTVVEYVNYNEQGHFYAAVFGLEELPLKRLQLIDGELDFEKLASGKYIIEGIHLDDFDQPDMSTKNFEVGEKVVLHNYIGKEELLKDKEYTTREFTVMGHVAVKTYSNSDRFYNQYTYYLPAEIYLLLVEEPVVMSYAFNAEDSEEANIEKFLKDYTENQEMGMNYSSKYSWLEEFDGLRDMVLLIGGALSLIIGLIGILNFMNAVLTSIITRRKEFAMLRSIGMTQRQLRNMLCFEGLYYAAFTGIFALGFSIIFSLLIVRNLSKMLWFLSYQFIIWPLLITLPVLLLLSILIPRVSLSATDKKSIVEKLREIEG